MTFNDHDGSTKSYGYMKEHEAVLHELDFVPFFEEIAVDIPEGTVMDVKLHDGSTLRVRKIDRDYDPTNRRGGAGGSRRGGDEGRSPDRCSVREHRASRLSWSS